MEEQLRIRAFDAAEWAPRRSLARHRWAIPAAMLLAVVLAALLAPWIAPQDPWDLAALRLEDGFLPPYWAEGAAAQYAPGAPRYLLGTDGQGRDLFSAILYGLRVSLLVGCAGIGLALAIGVAMGLLSGWYGGRFETAIMRLADVQLSFPSILIALFLMGVWGQGVGKIVLAVALVHWVLYARIARGVVLVEREKDYIAAVRALGAGAPRILARHLLPNLAAPLGVVSVVQFASVVILEATLSFLGLGVPVTRPSLGMLIKFGKDEFFSGYWWVWLFPGLALVLLMISINWLADVLRAEGAGRG